MAFGAEPDIKAWADRVALNPARIPPGEEPAAGAIAAVDRFKASIGSGMAKMAEFAGMS